MPWSDLLSRILPNPSCVNRYANKCCLCDWMYSVFWTVLREIREQLQASIKQILFNLSTKDSKPKEITHSTWFRPRSISKETVLGCWHYLTLPCSRVSWRTAQHYVLQSYTIYWYILYMLPFPFKVILGAKNKAGERQLTRCVEVPWKSSTVAFFGKTTAAKGLSPFLQPYREPLSSHGPFAVVQIAGISFFSASSSSVSFPTNLSFLFPNPMSFWIAHKISFK